MAITLPFSDDFASGGSPNSGVYTAIAGSLSDYTVSGSYALVGDPHTGTDQREGFYTTDTISGDFDVQWKLNMTENAVGQTGTVHGVALWIDNNNMIKMWRYYRSDIGWHNPAIQKVVSGSTTTLADITASGGDSDTTNYDRWYRIVKSGTTFTFYTSPDGSTWTQRYSGTISDWLSTQAWHIYTYAENNANTSLLKVDKITAAAPSTNVTVSASVLSATFSVPTYSVKYAFKVAASVLSATFSIPAYTTKQGLKVSASVLAATFSIPTYNAGVITVVTPSALAATFSVPSRSILTDQILAVAAALGLTFSTPSRTITQGTGVTVLGSVLASQFSIPAYTLAIVSNITIAASPLTLTFSLPTLAKVGSIWRKTARGSSDWTRVGRNST